MMRRVFRAAAILTAAAALAAPAAAAEAGVNDDVVCLAIFLAATGAAETQEARMGAAASSMYFAGRIEGATGKKALDLVEPVLESLSLVEIQRHGERCGEQMRVMGEEWIRRGEAMERAFEAGERGT